MLLKELIFLFLFVTKALARETMNLSDKIKGNN